MTAAAQQHLQTVINQWHHLDDMLDTHVSAPWPPAGRMTDYIAALDMADARAVHRQRTGQELEVPAGQPPINLDVVDTQRAVNLALVDCADNIADHIQRPAASRLRAASPRDDIALRIATATMAAIEADQNDPRRWSFTNSATRTAPYAAAWLLARIEDTDGPFRPLSPLLRERITERAAEAARRIETVLATGRRSTRVPHDCPHCRNQLDVHGGDGTDPALHCTRCGWTRTAHAQAA